MQLWGYDLPEYIARGNHIHRAAFGTSPSILCEIGLELEEYSVWVDL